MVGKWGCKNPLTIEERRKIKEGLDMQMTYREIADLVARNKTTIQYEVKRLGKDISKYDPEKAQEHFEQLQINKSPKISATLKEIWQKKLSKKK
jgi:IS30 family transposase